MPAPLYATKNIAQSGRRHTAVSGAAIERMSYGNIDFKVAAIAALQSELCAAPANAAAANDNRPLVRMAASSH